MGLILTKTAKVEDLHKAKHIGNGMHAGTSRVAHHEVCFQAAPDQMKLQQALTHQQDALCKQVLFSTAQLPCTTLTLTQTGQ